ncbi:MAG: hypothetical protein RI841_05665 [Halomonas sp.]|uniref:hypothetical protein n=1 Tax=Halomonas sp. TaxID=1486246 RepID=UPI002870100F|nr:hypothetical protein [Halomonas sp.]MDR9438969.1 hypothetical protein [Halomonas sp.]
MKDAVRHDSSTTLLRLAVDGDLATAEVDLQLSVKRPAPGGRRTGALHRVLADHEAMFEREDLQGHGSVAGMSQKAGLQPVFQASA